MLTRTTNRLLMSIAPIVIAAGLAQPAAAQSVTDPEITNHIDAEYAGSDRIDAYRVGVATDDGIVTLTGTVSNLLEKRRAEEIARATVGVEAVVNNIMVRAGTQSDNEIRLDARDALLADPAADAYEVAVGVRNGTATLTGTVESYAEKQLAEAVVAGVNGVRAINNNINIEYASTRPDPEIRADIINLLAHGVTIDDGLLDVSVSGGEVTLSGTVGSAAEKWNAYDLAWVSGVESVDVTGVDIEWWARDNMRREDVYTSTNDADLLEAVDDAIRYSPLVNDDNVTIAVDDGIITLTGTVDDLRAKNTAEDLAQNTVGVWDVYNYLRVDSPTLDDEELERDVRAALLRDPYVDRFDITVTVINGHAHLYGDVDTEFEKDQAESAAEAIDGVVDVSNYLGVSEEWDTEEDWEIAEDIRDELFWSPFVDSDDVSVVVLDGVATLTGTVDTLDERRAAVENALQGGARLVDNELHVAFGPEPLQP